MDDDPQRRRGPLTPDELAELRFEAGGPDLAAYGKAAYEAYRKWAGGKSLVTQAPLPAWDELSTPIQRAWIAAAGVVLEVARSVGDL